MHEPSYFERLRFEHDLINRRITWLLTSQTVLFAAYGIAVDRDVVPKASSFLVWTPIAGASVAALILIGIGAGIVAKRRVWQDENERRKVLRLDPVEWGVKTWITWVALVPDMLLPVVFGTAWMFIGLGQG